MSGNDDRFRERGTIEAVSYGPEDHGILTCWVRIDFASSSQGFGGLALDEKSGPEFLRSLCDAFGVSDVKALKWRGCYALRCFAHGTIEGLESVNTGLRFTLTGWRRRMFPEQTIASPLEEERRSIRLRIESARRSIADGERRLATIADTYRNWEGP